jgi:prepilin-type N-terminal cleavage/methylation domain-containing protein
MRTHKNIRVGFTLIEVLISVAILAMLMTALGVAFSASCKSYTENEAMYKNMNTARQALMRITTDIRTSQVVSAIGAGADNDADNYSCTLYQADGTHVRYLYNNSAATDYDNALEENALYFINNFSTTKDPYVLCRHVTAMVFDRTVVGSDVRNVQISMTVSDPAGTVSQSLNTAAVIRSTLGD